jgi:hypothetical protein
MYLDVEKQREYEFQLSLAQEKKKSAFANYHSA